MSKTGLYTQPSETGQGWTQTAVTQLILSALDWIWAQPAYISGYLDSSVLAAQLAAAGKRVILRTFFWDASGVYPKYKTWSSIKGVTAALNAAFAQIQQQIANVGGVKNLYAITIGEEEPAVSDNNWDTATAQQIADYTAGNNALYAMIKAAYPGLKVLGVISPLSSFTEAQVHAVKKDGLFCYSYTHDLTALKGLLARGQSLVTAEGTQADLFTLVYNCPGTGNLGTDPPNDPAYAGQAFAMIKALGYPNIGLYSEPSIFYNRYPAGSGLPADSDPLLYQQAMDAIITAEAAPAPGPSPAPAPAPPDIGTITFSLAKPDGTPVKVTVAVTLG
jgi:hypothetical protein